MDKVGVSAETWNAAVTAGASSVTNVSGVTVSDLEKTTLNRFKSLIETAKSIETTLASYKGYNTTSTQKMLAVADKIVEEDAAYGADFDAKTANLRFK